MTDDEGNELDRPRPRGQGDYGDELGVEQRVDALERRIGRAELDEDTRRAVAAVPMRLVALEGIVARIDERSSSLSHAHAQVRTELHDLREEVADSIRELRGLLTHRFDRVDGAHAEAAAARWQNRPYVDRLKDVMVIATPIILGLLTLAGVIYAARVGTPGK